jgi:hypothetical protein
VWGVACDVYDPSGWQKETDEWWQKDTKQETFMYVLTADNDIPRISAPPEVVLQHYGVSRDLMNTIMGLNDCKNFSFSQLADWITDNVLRPNAQRLQLTTTESSHV